MAIQPLSFPTYQINSTVDPSTWSSLGNLGNVYRSAQADQLKRSTLGQLGDDAAKNANLLIASGHPELAQLGLTLQNRLQDQAREDTRYATTDARANAQLAIAQAQEKRAAEKDEEDTPEFRAKRLAKTNPEMLQTPQGKEFVVTGKMPPPRDPTFEEQVNKRKQVAADLGIKPDSPAYQSYVATGKMPREDAQAMTATDKKILKDTDDSIITHRAVIASLNRAKMLSPKAFTGPGAGGRGYAASFLGETSDWGKGGVATENLSNEVLNNALSQLKSIFGAAPTEGERKILLELQGSVGKTDRVRQDIYDRAISMAQDRLNEEMKRADELRGGTFYKPGGGATASAAPKAVPTFKIEPD